MMEKAQKFQVIKICKNVLERDKTYCYNKTKIIGGSAFSQCSGLQTVEIPSTVTSIENLTFERCSNLSSIIINNKEGSIDGAPWGAPKGMRAITWKK